MKKIVKVVGAIIENENGEILCTLRPKNKSLGNMWEFPGGKIESGEEKEEALKRELREELSLEIDVDRYFIEVEKEYENVIINLTCYICKFYNNMSFELKEHSGFVWLKRENLTSLVWVPTDYPIVEKLILGE